MRRYYEELTITRRQHRTHMRRLHGWPKKPVTCPCDRQQGRFRKIDAFDCGKTRCSVCHSEKFGRGGKHLPGKSDKLADIRMAEGLMELGRMFDGTVDEG